jgi:uncharacterized membrane protein
VCDAFFNPCTYPQGINNRGQIVGFAQLLGGPQGFLRETGGAMQTLPASPANTGSVANSINDRDEIVGSYSDGRNTHGFLLRNGTFTTIDFPGVSITVCTGINNSGLITGRYIQSDDSVHGFLWQHGDFIATFQVFMNGANTDTTPTAINDRGQVVGTFRNSIGNGAFLRNPDGTVRIIDLNALLQPVGGTVGIALLTGINDRGDLVGSFFGGFMEIFGFLATRAVPGP